MQIVHAVLFIRTPGQDVSSVLRAKPRLAGQAVLTAMATAVTTRSASESDSEYRQSVDVGVVLLARLLSEARLAGLLPVQGRGSDWGGGPLELLSSDLLSAVLDAVRRCGSDAATIEAAMSLLRDVQVCRRCLSSDDPGESLIL